MCRDMMFVRKRFIHIILLQRHRCMTIIVCHRLSIGYGTTGVPRDLGLVDSTTQIVGVSRTDCFIRNIRDKQQEYNRVHQPNRIFLL